VLGGGVGGLPLEALDAGVVEGGVQTSEALDSVVDGGLDVVLVGDVTGKYESLAAFGGDEPRGLLQPVGGQVDEGDLCSGAGEGQGGGAAEPGSGSSDEATLMSVLLPVSTYVAGEPVRRALDGVDRRTGDLHASSSFRCAWCPRGRGRGQGFRRVLMARRSSMAL
jgi:hypothetical protein